MRHLHLFLPYGGLVILLIEIKFLLITLKSPTFAIELVPIAHGESSIFTI